MSTTTEELQFDFAQVEADPSLMRRFTFGAFAGDVVFRNEGEHGNLVSGIDVRRYDDYDDAGKPISTVIGRITRPTAGDVITLMKDKVSLTQELLAVTLE